MKRKLKISSNSSLINKINHDINNRNLLSKKEIIEFVALHSHTKNSQLFLRQEKNKIRNLIDTATKKKQLTFKNDNICAEKFFRWAAEKTYKQELRWPFLREILNIPDVYSLSIQIQNTVLPAEKDLKGEYSKLLKRYTTLKSELLKLKEENKKLQLKIRQINGSKRGNYN